ncbi:MAG: hypothetical protein H0V79_08650 [Actinobacteria bacterium]|nr:hypothetical protein [Actinomycetota bacterium]
MRCFAAAALVGLILAATAAATIKPARGMTGLALGMTPAQVQVKLGRPIGKGSGRWYYARVWVGFRARRVVELTTTRSAERLANGLGVDSTEAQIRSAFPQANCAAAAPFRRCRLGSGEPGTRVTDFTIGRGRVLQITIAQLP